MAAIHAEFPGSRGSNSLASQDYAETISRLFRKQSHTALQKVLSRLFPSDLARILDGYPEEEASKIFFLIPSHGLAASTLKHMGAELRNHLMQDFSPDKLIPILEELPPDDRADIIGQLDSKLAKRFMGGLDEERMREVEDLLQYDSDTAGGLMTSDFFALTADTTVGAAIEAVRSLPYFEMVFYLYIVDDKRRLIGVSSLRQLILNDPSKTLAEIMNSRTIKVLTNTPSTDVADMVKHYRLLGVPVVDDMDVLVGVVTVDDIISTLEQDITEDVLKMSANAPPEVAQQSFMKTLKLRLPWLLAALGGGLLASGVIDLFGSLLGHKMALAAFIPLVMNMAGSVGTATATVAAHGLTAKGSRMGQIAGLFGTELGIGLVLGCINGLVGGLTAWFLFKDPLLGKVVGVTVLLNMLFGAFIALVLSMLSERLRANPGMISGRILTTILDIIGVLNYFVIATFVLGV
ncbi:MAG: magnesium transporter [Magnetococcales bacterium]|nr:magnesium transporter [Magnetococcales bacterium]